jgi:N-acetylglucosaminyldiphosphoundecaprenol N-acetyl-beta-D-mannosaminyltransferase
MGNVPHFIQSAATSMIGETALTPENIDLVVAEQQGTLTDSEQARPTNFRRILGIDFFDGSATAAIALMRNGGLLVIPAAPALKDLDRNPDYREALLNADLAITDSAFMVLIWNGLQSESIKRLSGLEYLRALLLDPDVRRPGNTLWIMANPISAKRNLDWLQGQGITVPEDNIYMAPMYDSGPISDPALLDRLERLRPQHVIMTIGGGTQERLGLYLKRNLASRPAIHCIGAAIAFLSGDQVHIPVWADKYYLGWLLRSLSEPKRYVPRYWEARKLLALMVRHRDRLPDLKS